MNGIDISVYQGTVDYDAVAKSGKIAFVYAKATEGTREVDDQFLANHDRARSRGGLKFGAYHFFHFGLDPITQANHFLTVAENRLGELRPMVDVEGAGQDGVTDLDELIFKLASFANHIEGMIGKKPIIYTDPGDWNGFMQGTDAFSGHPLWVAEYNSDAAPTLPNGFTDWVIWQYTDSFTVPGISGGVDGDRVNPKNEARIYR